MRVQFRRINDNFTPWFTVGPLTQINEEKRVTVAGQVAESDGHFFLRTYVDEQGNKFFTFGYWNDDPKQRPGHGGYWSSNAESIKHHFGIDLIECVVKSNPGLPGEFIADSTAMAILKSDVPLPRCLEYRYNICSVEIMPVSGQDWPRGNDYFMSTVLNAAGELIYPIRSCSSTNGIECGFYSRYECRGCPKLVCETLKFNPK